MLKRSDATPKSELEDFKTKTLLVSTLYNLNIGSVNIADIKDLEDAEESEFKSIFAEKCVECSKLCDFSCEMSDKEAKSKKLK